MIFCFSCLSSSPDPCDWSNRLWGELPSLVPRSSDCNLQRATGWKLPATGLPHPYQCFGVQPKADLLPHVSSQRFGVTKPHQSTAVVNLKVMPPINAITTLLAPLTRINDRAIGTSSCIIRCTGPRSSPPFSPTTQILLTGSKAKYAHDSKFLGLMSHLSVCRGRGKEYRLIKMISPLLDNILN